MPGAVRWIAVTVLLVVVLLGLALGVAYGVSEVRLKRVHAVAADPPIALGEDSATLGRGAHLAHVIASCAECHGDDLGGKVYADAGLMGIIVGPNLTTGRGGVGATLLDEDWIRAIRHGVRPDGRSLIVMPSETFVHLSRQDLAAVLSYVKARPPVDRELPATRIRLLGRALLASGRLPILVADKTPDVPLSDGVPIGSTKEYGGYLADVSGCRGCHGLQLSGGRVAGPPGTPPTSNLTVAGPIGSWQEADFTRAMRQGLRPDGSLIDGFMPWRRFAAMTDDELHALWLYLRSVPAREYGNR